MFQYLSHILPSTNPGLPEQTLVAGALDAGAPLSPEALGGQLKLQGDGLQVLVVTADSLELIAQSGQDV